MPITLADKILALLAEATTPLTAAGPKRDSAEAGKLAAGNGAAELGGGRSPERDLEIGRPEAVQRLASELQFLYLHILLHSKLPSWQSGRRDFASGRHRPIVS